jgi:hypothetical protein
VELFMDSIPSSNDIKFFGESKEESKNWSFPGICIHELQVLQACMWLLWGQGQSQYYKLP